MTDAKAKNLIIETGLHSLRVPYIHAAKGRAGSLIFVLLEIEDADIWRLI